MKQDMRDMSRKKWNTDGSTIEEINCGSMLRVADAVEAMAKDRNQIEQDLKFYKEAYDRHTKQIDQLTRSRSALRGVITRMNGRTKK